VCVELYTSVRGRSSQYSAWDHWVCWTSSVD